MDNYKITFICMEYRRFSKFTICQTEGTSWNGIGPANTTGCSDQTNRGKINKQNLTPAEYIRTC